MTERKMWLYWVCGIGVFHQAILLVGIARYNYPTTPPAGFYSSPMMLSVIAVTSAAIVFLAALPLIKCGTKNEGVALLGAGLLVWYTFQYLGLTPDGWMVDKILVVFSFWAVLIGALILLYRAWLAFCDLAGW